jgi:hypothetical protein
MKRILVKIHPRCDGTDDFNLEEPSSQFTGSDVGHPFKSKPLPASIGRLNSGMLQPQVVSKAGEWLFKQLSKHPAVAQALTQALTLPPAQLCPIYIQDQSSRVQSLPWETLFTSASSFLALDGRWPVGRVTNSEETLTTLEYTFGVPVKMTAILSALGVPARAEWDAIHGAIQKTGLPVSLRVLVSEDALYHHIQSVGDPDVTVDYMPADAKLLRDDIELFEPSVLHFFCHGSNNTKPELHLALREDWLHPQGSGSLKLEVESLVKISDVKTFNWLVTLNCCESAAAVKNSQAFARSLAAKGFPVVVGLREVVTDSDAHLLCQNLYEDCFAEIQSAIRAGLVTFEICWPKMLSAARERLGLKYASGNTLSGAAPEVKQWTLPILYTRRAPVLLRPSPTSNSWLLQKSQTLRQCREGFAIMPGMPESILDNLNERDSETGALSDTAAAAAY